MFTRLIEKTFDDNPFQEIVDISCKIIDNPIVIISSNFKILFNSDKLQVKDKTWKNSVERGFITLEFGCNLNNWEKFRIKNKNYLEFTTISSSPRRFYKLQYGDYFLGYLNILESNHKINDICDEDYDKLVKIISKELYTRNNSQSSVRNYSDEDILYSLHNNEFRSDLHFKQRAENFDINNHRDYIVAVVDVSEHTSYNADSDDLKQKILDIFDECVIINHTSYLYILLYKEKINLTERMKRFLIELNLSFGVSSAFRNLYDYKTYETEALDSLKLKKYLDDDQLVTSFNDVKIFKILTDYDFERDYVHYLDSTILKILEHDHLHNTELLTTLYYYLKYEKSVKIVSSKLYIHRNTVNYRIKQLREKFEIDFDDFHCLVRLYLSIQLYYIHEKKLD